MLQLFHFSALLLQTVAGQYLLCDTSKTAIKVMQVIYTVHAHVPYACLMSFIYDVGRKVVVVL